MSKLIAAHTNSGIGYPGYINFTREDDGTISVHFRGDPTVRPDGEYICGYAADKGKPGRCTAGDDHCNNYCNMAPEKGPMQRAPLSTVQVFEGVTGTLKLSATAFAELIATAKSDEVAK